MADDSVVAIMQMLDEDSSSSDEGESDNDFQLVFQGPLLLALGRDKKKKIENYVEEVIPKYTLDDFQRFFRVLQHFVKKYIVWPKDRNIDTVTRAFTDKRGFPDVIGALDSSHIQIRPPKEHSQNSELWDNGQNLCRQEHLIGDGGFPLTTWLLTLFRDNGHLTPLQRHYNFCLSSTRQVKKKPSP